MPRSTCQWYLPVPSRASTFRRSSVIVALASVALVATLHAQSLDAVMDGVVIDVSGAPLPGATIAAMHDATGVTRVAVTDVQGRYVFHALPAGTYTVQTTLDGFASSTQQAQPLYVGTTVTIDIELKLAGMAEEVTVRGTLPLLERSQHSLTRIVQKAEIDALPVVTRNFNELAALAPGVTKTGVFGGVDINGRHDFQNGTLVDGVSAERHHLGDQRVAFAQDWIQEFQVVTGQFNAEFGQAAGGVLNVVTRSGGNALSGRAYGFVRDDAFDATPAFADRKSPLREYRLGATVGGPVVSNRVFYFAGVERFDNASSNVVRSSFATANGSFQSTDKQTLWLAKLDVNVSTLHQLRLRYNGQQRDMTGRDVGGISTQEHGRFSDTHASDIAANWTWVTSPSMLNEVRAAWSSSVPTTGCNLAADHPSSTRFELAYPGAQFGCPLNFGTIAEKQFQLIHNLTWARGSHEIKAGTQTYWTRSFGDFRNVRDGQYSFPGDRPFGLNDPESYPFSFVMIQGGSTWNAPSWSSGVFVQDRWRPRQNLTINLGVRYDVDGSLTALNPIIVQNKGRHTLDLDSDNVAPRVGIAWTPFDDARTVIRGGAGLFYDQNHNNITTAVLLNNVLVDRVVAVNANSPVLNPFWPDIASARRLLAEALAQGSTPDLSHLGTVPGATNDVNERLEIPASLQYSGGVAHEFGGALSVSADVVDVRGRDLYVISNVNLHPVTFQRIDPTYSVINEFGNGGWSNYKALQVQASVIPHAGRLLKIAYTLAGHRTNTHATLSGGTATNPFDLSEDEGPAHNDVRHNLAINGSAVLPYGVQVAGIWTYRSQAPYSATSNAPRPDGKPFGFRPEPANGRRGDSATSLDLRLGKNISLGTSASASAFVEVFNVLNAVNYSGYVQTVSSALFGQPTAAGPKRRAQLGLRIDF